MEQAWLPEKQNSEPGSSAGRASGWKCWHLGGRQGQVTPQGLGGRLRSQDDYSRSPFVFFPLEFLQALVGSLRRPRLALLSFQLSRMVRSAPFRNTRSHDGTASGRDVSQRPSTCFPPSPSLRSGRGEALAGLGTGACSVHRMSPAAFHEHLAPGSGRGVLVARDARLPCQFQFSS